jgi:FkbM family methyltransferase
MNPYRSFYDDILAQAGGQWIDFEGVVASVYRAVLCSGDWALDVGAHQGAHTYQMAEIVAPSGCVLAIEAAPPMLDVLRDNMRRFYMHLAPNVIIHDCGVSDREGEAKFFFVPALAGLSGLRKRSVLGNATVVETTVRVATIDQLCADAGSIRFMKIDIEGGEYHALLGAERTIARHEPVVCFEFGPSSPKDFSYSLDSFIGFWEDVGYEVFDLFGNRQTVDAWNTPVVWDYIALPRQFTRHRTIFEAVARGLEDRLRYTLPETVTR